MVHIKKKKEKKLRGKKIIHMHFGSQVDGKI